jgi:hypothetical protein
VPGGVLHSPASWSRLGTQKRPKGDCGLVQCALTLLALPERLVKEYDPLIATGFGVRPPGRATAAPRSNRVVEFSLGRPRCLIRLRYREIARSQARRLSAKGPRSLT